MMKNIIPASFYNYFKDCYKSDYKEFVVDNLLSVKYKYKWFVKGKEELFNDNLPLIPFNNPKITELEKDIELYKLEKKLFYACFFVLGKSSNPLVKDKRLCAPLVLFPANIIQKEGLNYLEIERDSFIVNRGILSKLNLRNESVGKELFIKDFTELIDRGSGNYLSLKTLMYKYFSNLDTEELLLNPQVWSAAKIRASYAKEAYQPDEYKIVPAAASILVEKSQSSLKVLNDLGQMANENMFNDSLQELFNGANSKMDAAFSYFKSRLNSEQNKALINASCFTNSVLVGPPGTGKSYTITSVIADSVVNGKSVLVVSKTKQAVEVVRKMLETDYKLKNHIIHTSGNKYK